MKFTSGLCCFSQRALLYQKGNILRQNTQTGLKSCSSPSYGISAWTCSVSESMAEEARNGSS